MQEEKRNDRNKTPVPELSEHLHRFGSRHEDSRGREGYKRTSKAVMGCISLLPKAIQKAWMQRDAGATLSSTCAMPLNSGNVPNSTACCLPFSGTSQLSSVTHQLSQFTSRTRAKTEQIPATGEVSMDCGVDPTSSPPVVGTHHVSFLT